MADSGALADQLRAGLASAGITQAELARRAGVTRAYVGRLLTGSQAAPTLEVVEALAAALALGPVERLRLYTAAGVMPPELVATLGRPAVAQLLTALAAAPGERQDRLEQVLTAALELAEEPAIARFLIRLVSAPSDRQTAIQRLLTAVLDIMEAPVTA